MSPMIGVASYNFRIVENEGLVLELLVAGEAPVRVLMPLSTAKLLSIGLRKILKEYERQSGYVVRANPDWMQAHGVALEDW